MDFVTGFQPAYENPYISHSTGAAGSNEVLQTEVTTASSLPLRSYKHIRTHTHIHKHTHVLHKLLTSPMLLFPHTICTHAHMYTAHVQPATRARYPTKTAKGCSHPSVEFSRVPRKHGDETVVWPRPDREARSLSEAIVRANGMFRMLLCMDVRLVHPAGHLFCKIGTC